MAHEIQRYFAKAELITLSSVLQVNSFFFSFFFFIIPILLE